MSYNQKRLSLERTLAIVGSSAVGKSALSQVFVQKPFPVRYCPTIEEIHLFEVFKSNNDSFYKLTLYDTGGLEGLEPIPEKYINSHGFILVYSVADRQSFENIKLIYENIKNETYTKNTHIVLIGNKKDLNDQRCVSYEEGLKLAENLRESGSMVSFIEASAKTGERVEDIITSLLDLIDCMDHSNRLDTDNPTNQLLKMNTRKASSSSSVSSSSSSSPFSNRIDNNCTIC